MKDIDLEEAVATVIKVANLEPKEDNMRDLIRAVEKWSIKRDLHNGDPIKQFQKITEECGELASALVRDQKVELKDAIGDVAVTLIILAQQYRIDVDFLNNRVIGNESQDVDKSFLWLSKTIGDIAHKLMGYSDRSLKGFVGAAWWHLEDIAEAKGMTLQGCLTYAYLEIKDRKGKTVDGTFLKEGDY